METRAHHVVVGLFVIVMLIGMVMATVWLTRPQFQREGQIYDIFFRGSVSGLNEGATVRYKGVPIGRVRNIRLDPENVERIRVRIEVDNGTPIKEDAVASLELQGITGLAFVQISGGSNASPVVQTPAGRSYPVIASRPSQLEEVVASAPALFTRATQVADRLTELLDDENRAAISRSLGNLEKATGVLAQHSGDVDRLIGDAAGTTTALRSLAENADASLRRVTEDAEAMLTRLNKALSDKDGIGDRLAMTLDNADRAVKGFGQVAGRLDSILQENRGPLHDFTQRSLNDAAQLVVETRALVTQLNRIADQIERDPARFFLGDRREGYRPR